MFPNEKIFSAVGLYGGPIAIITLIYAVVITGLQRMKGPPASREGRFRLLAYLSFAFCLFAIAASTYVKTSGTSDPKRDTINQTNGPLSPIIPNNTGNVTVSNKQVEESKDKK